RRKRRLGTNHRYSPPLNNAHGSDGYMPTAVRQYACVRLTRTQRRNLRMTSFITQCPHCRTSFRVNRAQLAAARGVVRCGACMELFNALQQLSEEDKLRARAVEPPAKVPVQPPPAARPEDDTLWIHDDLDLDSLDLDEELAKLERE